MANIYLNLPAPAGNGAGAAVDVSTMGAEKTIVVGGSMIGQITIEFSNELVPTQFAPLKTIQNNGEFDAMVAARWMRVSVSGFKEGAANVDVGADDGGCEFDNLPTTVGDGLGAAVNVATRGPFRTVHVVGQFRGACIIEISEDNVSWAQVMVFLYPGAQSKLLNAQFFRVRRQNVPLVSPGQPEVNLGSAVPVSGGGGGGPTNWQSFDYTCTGLEGQSFTVPIPVAQPNALYQVRWDAGEVFRQFTLVWLPASRLVGSFDVELSTEPHEGDVIHFDVFNP